MINEDIRVYLASGWFSDEQKRKMNSVRDLLLEMEFKVFAPFYDGVVLNSANDSLEQRRKIFNENVKCISGFPLVVAIIDEYDPGTIWEMGYAAGYADVMYAEGYLYSSKTICYSERTDRTPNVMLAQSCWGYASGLHQLKQQLDRFVQRKEPANFIKFERGKIQ